MEYFYIDNQKFQKLKNGEKSILVELSFYDEGLKRPQFKKELIKFLKEVPKGYEFKITVFCSNHWRSSKEGYSDNKKNPPFYNPAEYYKEDIENDNYYETMERINEETLYYSATLTLRKKKNKSGGESIDKNNNCLFYCLKKSNINTTWKYPHSLKKFLKLDQNDKIHYSNLFKIEDKIKTKINLTGDYNYISGKDYKKTINLILKNGHYKLEDTKKKKKNNLISNASKKNRSLLVYHINNKENKTYYYDGKKYFTKFNDEEKKNYYSHSKYHFRIVNIRYENIDKVNDYLKNEYDSYLKDINEIKEKFNYDILKFVDLKNFSLYYSYHYGLKNFDIEDMSEHETLWIKQALTGGLLNCKKGEFKNCSCYDVNSMYPSILANDNLQLPIKKGKFIKLNTLPEIIPYGIYRINILDNPHGRGDKEEINKNIFKINKTGKYTHLDLKVLVKENYKFELVQDNEANALIYDGKTRTSTQSLFKKYMTEFYKLKSILKSKSSKLILNQLWGALTQQKNHTKNLDELETFDNIKIVYPFTNRKTNEKSFKVVENVNKEYKFNMARISPFLVAKGRYNMYNLINKYNLKEEILRIHTDGFIINKKINGLKIDKEMGNMKLEYSNKDIEIKNVNKINKLN